MAQIKKISTELQLLDKFLDTSGDAGTSGQILSSTATGINWIDGSAIPGVPGGSGTLNTIPLWTPDGDTLGNSPITISGNNSSFAGKIGIPDGSDVFWGGGYGNGAPVLAANGTTMKMYPSGSTSGIQFSLSPTAAIFYGNVGIGTTSPTDGKLQVVGKQLFEQVLMVRLL